jgi:hypothetical protein
MDAGSQVSQTKSAADEPTSQDIVKWDRHELLKWMQRKLYMQLEADEVKMLRDARINGYAFLDKNSDFDFYRKAVGLTPGTSQNIVALARNTGKKSIPFGCHGRYSRHRLTVLQGTANKPALRVHPPLPPTRGS